MTTRKGGFPLFCLWAAAVAAYIPSLSGSFLLDDKSHILANAALLRPSAWWRFFLDARAMTDDPGLASHVYRPLTALSFALNAWFGGMNPFWFHLTDVALHAAVTCLVFVFVRERVKPAWAAFAAALLFCLHPAQAESVSYISGARPNALSLLFCLLAFGWDAPRPRLAWAAFAAGLLCKETAVFLPLALAARHWQERPAAADAAWAHGCARRLLPYLAVLAAYLLLRGWVLGRVAQHAPWGGDWLSHLGWAVRGLAEDVRIALFPVALRPCYTFLAGGSFRCQTVALSGALLCLGAAALRALSRRSDPGFGWTWFLAALAPVSNLVPIAAFAADRFLYFPLVGLALAAGAALEALARAATAARLRPLPQATLASGFLALLLANAEQQLRWDNEFHLDSLAYAAAPEDPCTALNLTSHYYNWRMHDRAVALATSALRPGVPEEGRREALEKRALALMGAGRITEAAVSLDRAIALEPDSPSLRRYRARCARAPAGPSPTSRTSSGF